MTDTPRDRTPSPYPTWSAPPAPAPVWLGDADRPNPVPASPPETATPPDPPAGPPPASPPSRDPPPAWGEEPAPPPASEPVPPPPDTGPRPRLFGPQPDSLRNREPPPEPDVAPLPETAPPPEGDGFWDEDLAGEPPPWESDEPPPRPPPELDDLLDPPAPERDPPEERVPEPPGPGEDGGADGGPGAVIRDSMRRNMGEAAGLPSPDAPGPDHFVEAARALSAESRILAATVEGLEASLEAARPLLENLPGLERAVRTNAADFARWRTAHRARWGAVALVLLCLLVPAAFAAGIAAQQHFRLLPPHDPSRGWAGHIWKHYGEDISACIVAAGQADSGLAECRVQVRGK